MTAWTSDELDEIGTAEGLRIAPRRRDGTLRNPLPVWVVRHGDDLYVRSVNGPTAAWFRGARARPEGHVRAGGVEKDVAFVEVDDQSNAGLGDRIDAAYQAKYGRRYPTIVPSIVRPEPRAATLKLVPRSPTT
jgi:hypothetical protein